MKSSASQKQSIVINKKAKFDYFIIETLEAGLALQGWEIKSLRAAKVQLRDTYVIFKQEEAYLIGAIITPLISCSTHIKAEADRTRKLLLHRKETQTLMGQVQQKGYTLIPLSLYWSQENNKGKVKCKLALVKGKHDYDKRKTIKEREWNINKQRITRNFA